MYNAQVWNVYKNKPKSTQTHRFVSKFYPVIYKTLLPPSFVFWNSSAGGKKPNNPDSSGLGLSPEMPPPPRDRRADSRELFLSWGITPWWLSGSWSSTISELTYNHQGADPQPPASWSSTTRELFLNSTGDSPRCPQPPQYRAELQGHCARELSDVCPRARRAAQHGNAATPARGLEKTVQDLLGTAATAAGLSPPRREHCGASPRPQTHRPNTTLAISKHFQNVTTWLDRRATRSTPRFGRWAVRPRARRVLRGAPAFATHPSSPRCPPGWRRSRTAPSACCAGTGRRRGSWRRSRGRWWAGTRGKAGRPPCWSPRPAPAGRAAGTRPPGSGGTGPAARGETGRQRSLLSRRHRVTPTASRTPASAPHRPPPQANPGPATKWVEIIISNAHPTATAAHRRGSTGKPPATDTSHGHQPAASPTGRGRRSLARHPLHNQRVQSGGLRQGDVTPRGTQNPRCHAGGKGFF